jgi:hypothetical protein
VQKESVIQCFQRIALLSLDRLFTAPAERDLVISLIFKSLSLVLESADSVKKASLKETIVETMAHCVSNYRTAQHQGLEFRIVDEYLREEYLADFVAELVDSLHVQYDYPMLGDAVLM